MQIRYVVAFAGLIVGLLCRVAAAQEEQPRRLEQYKRVHERILEEITNHDPAAAAADARGYLERYPADAESQYMLAVALSQLGQKADAVAAMQAAIRSGMSPGRFVGGTLTGLDGLRETAEYRELKAGFAHTPIHGPMLGCLTGRSVTVWARTADAQDVEVVVSRARDLRDPLHSATVRTSAERDFTATLPVVGLEPQTDYYYALVIDGERGSPVHAFHTPPERGNPIKFRIAFGGGAGYVPENERMWDTIRGGRPDALFLLGDNVYIDHPTNPAMQHYCYYRRQSRPEFRDLIAITAVYSIWDDHDFGTNDCAVGPALDDPPWKRLVWRVFENNWANPGYGGGEAQPGCYYDFMIGDVHFILLDGRYYRTPQKYTEGPLSMLGAAQRAWLKETLAASRGTFKVLCSPVPWVLEAKGSSPDTWNGFRDERQEIFDFLDEHRIEGVVLMSADRHRSDLWKIPREWGYTFYEFNSSRLTNQARHPTMPAAEFSYNAKNSYGQVDFDTTAADPTVTYRVVTIDSETVHERTIRRSELTVR